MDTTAVLTKTQINKKIRGQSRPIVCNECGNHWTHFDESGFRSAVYYCDLCANRNRVFQNKEYKLKSMNPVNLKQCDNGGSFLMDATITCPRCKSSDVEISYHFNHCD